MSKPLTWPTKTVAEKFTNGVDWTAVLGDATISSVAAEVTQGDVTITDPSATSYSGAVQSVWVTGGTKGQHTVRCKATLSDGRVLHQDCRFSVIE